MAVYYHSKRKKIRGWKRRLRFIKQWGEHIKVPYLPNFYKSGYDYERCYLPSFYTLERRHPPLRIYKEIIEKYIAAFDEWEKVYKNQETPFDLLLWIYDPAYIQSEIICYRMDYAAEQKSFAWESECNKPFPFKKFASPNYDLKQFEWTLGDDAAIIFQSEIDDEGLNVNEYLNDGYIKKVQSENEIYYKKRLGDIWIGRRKKGCSKT
jgi:hypothetical protein